MRVFYPLCIPLLAFALSVSAAPIVTPYAQRAPLEIRAVHLLATNAAVYSLVDAAIDLSATYDNPFDSEDISVDALVRSPSGKSMSLPAFLGRAYERTLEDGKEKLTPRGKPMWQVRLTATEPGIHEVTVTVRDRSGSATSKPVSFTAVRSQSSGFVRISPRDRRYFEHDNGRAYFPVGANVCWAYAGGTFDYDGWFSGYATNGGNYARLWLSPNWTTFALERSGKREEGLGLGQFDLGNAWRIDYVLDLAARHGMSVMLCIDSYNILRQKDGYPQWESTPHNQANGGPLLHPTEFWTNAVAAKVYRDKLRYLVGRYSARTAVLSWEFWNEVDITTGYRTGPVREWHARMADHLRKLDPYHHLITTSFASTPGDKQIDLLPGLDYVQTHHYNSPDLAVTIANAQSQKRAYDKPHLVGEIGADSGGPRAKDDPLGLQVHDPQWVSIAVGAAGTAQPWWWNNLIHPRNLYPLFGAAARFCAGIDWPTEHFRPVVPRIDWQTKPGTLPRRDVLFTGGPTGWEPSEFNRPRHVQVTRFGAEGELPVAGIQHGTANHPREHNPVTFEVDLPWPTRLEIQVGDVSGYGGASLKTTLDGKPVFTNVFADPDGSKSGTTLKKYAGDYAVAIPAGKHVVVVENVGADWFMVEYKLRNAVERTVPPLLAWASVGANTAILWTRVEERTWQKVCARKEIVAPCPPTVVTLPDLTPGKWRAEVWDTWKGAVTETMLMEVPASGDARLQLGTVATDVAVKWTRLP